MVYYLILFTSVFIALSTVSVYGIVDHWLWPWIAVLIFFSAFFFCLVLYLLYCAFLSFFVDIHKPIHRQNRYFYYILVETANLALKLLNVKVHFSGKEFLPEDSRFLLVCNHIAWLDPAAALILFKKYHLAFISRKENYSYPVANKFLHKAACLSIDREDNRDALKTINKASELISEGVCAVGIFPEGWVTKTGELQEFRHGAFRIAKKSGCPVLVTHISGSDMIFRRPLWKRCNVYFEIKGIVPAEFVNKHKTAEISAFAKEIMTK